MSFCNLVDMKPIEEATTVEVESLPSPAAVNLKPPPKIEQNQSFDDDDFANKPVAMKSNAAAAPVKATVYSVADLQMATDSFNMDNLIGEGTLGRVYKAQFSDGKVKNYELPIMCYSFLLIRKIGLKYIEPVAQMKNWNTMVPSSAFLSYSCFLHATKYFLVMQCGSGLDDIDYLFSFYSN